MVWITQKYDINHCKSGVHYGYEIPEDRIFQTVNIMLDVHKYYDVNDMHTLISTGVNIFNVDLTVHDETFFKNIKNAIVKAEKLPSIFPESYYRPTSLAVTMSIQSPVCVDERVDIIILKEVTKIDELHEFRKEKHELSSIPILLWLSTFEMDDTNELIKISDGIILDLQSMDKFECFYYIVKMCKEAYKPIFYFKSNLVADYNQSDCNDRKVLVVAAKLVNAHIDGAVLVDDNDDALPTESIQSLVKAVRVAENDIKPDKEYLKTSLSFKTPVLPPFAIALAVSRAALHCGASGILVFTVSGRSAKILTFASPPCPVLAITAHVTTARQLHLYRKVMPLFYNLSRATSWQDECRNRLHFGTHFALKTGLFRSGAKLVVLAPTEEGTGYCDSFRIVAVP